VLASTLDGMAGETNRPSQDDHHLRQVMRHKLIPQLSLSALLLCFSDLSRRVSKGLSRSRVESGWVMLALRHASESIRFQSGRSVFAEAARDINGSRQFRRSRNRVLLIVT